jgi:hypothetical protein
MPKKGGKAEKGPSKDDQLVESQHQVAALKLEISEETKIRERLERENLNKIQQIGTIEDVIRSTREKHSEEIEILGSEALTEKSGKDYSITVGSETLRRVCAASLTLFRRCRCWRTKSGPWNGTWRHTA